MVGEISEDGNWVWNGTSWDPVEAPNEVVPEPRQVETPVITHDVGLESNNQPNPGLITELNELSFPAPLPMVSDSAPSNGNESSLPKVMRILSGTIGILMSVVLLMFLLGFVTQANADNIDMFSDEGDSDADDLANAIKTIQILTYLSVALVVGIIVVSVMNMMNKTSWWWLPAATIFLTVIFAGTAFYMANSYNAYSATCDSEIYSDCDEISDESMFSQDSMFAGYCSIIGFVIIGLMSLVVRAKSGVKFEASEDGDFVSQTASSGDKSIKAIVVISVILLLLGSGVTFMVFNALKNPVMADSSGDEVNFVFDVRDAWDSSNGHVMSENASDALVVVDMIESTRDYERHWEFISIEIVPETGERYTCYWWQLDRNTGCEFDELDANMNGYWEAGESLIIYEDSVTNICSGDNGGCEIAVEVTIGSIEGDWEYNSEWYYGYADAAE